MKASKRKRLGLHAARSRGGTVLIFTVLLFTCAFSALPVVYSLLQSLKPLNELFAFPPRFFVENPTGENFQRLFQLTNSLWVPFSRYVFNSVFVSVAGTFCYVIIASMAGFALAIGRFPGARFINEVIVKALLFSNPVLMVAQYIILSKGGMLNTYQAMILPTLAMPLGLFLMRQFIVQMVPLSIIEAARIDGASLFKTFWRVVMPAVKPAWLTLVILTFQTLWAGAGSAYIYKESFKVLPTVLAQIAAGGTARLGVAAAAAVLMLVPPVVIFIFAQKQVIETMATSGIKE